MSKPKPRRIDASACPVADGDQICYPHEGEWVEVLSGMTAGQMQAVAHLQRIGVEMDALQGEPDQGIKSFALLEPYYAEIQALVATRLIDWNWTDDLGEPLPKPDRTTGPLNQLRLEELYWLLTAAQGETLDDRKNGSARSLTTSSGTESTATAVSERTTGHSRTRR